MMNYRYASGWARANPVGQAISKLTPWYRVMCRAGDFWPGIKSAIPTGQYGGDLASICRTEAQAAWEGRSELVVMWSGGIDSTLLAALLVECRPEGGLIRLCSDRATLEWDTHQGLQWLLSHGCTKLEIDPAELRAVVGRGGMVVAGYHADTLLSGDIVRYNDLYERIFDISVEDMFVEITKFPLTVVQKYLADIKPLLDLCPLEQTAANVAWWLDYTCAWDSDEMALKYAVDIDPPGVGYFNFYGSDAFQLWAVQDATLKIGRTKETHKQVYLDLLSEVMGFAPEMPVTTEPSREYYQNEAITRQLLAIKEDWTLVESGT